MSRVLDHLVKDGTLSPSQANEVLRVQEAKEGNVLDILLETGKIRDVPLARALSQTYQRPLVNLTRARITKSALRRASGEFCRRHQVMPFSVDPNTGELLVALSDPDQRTAIEALRFRNNQNIKTFIAPRKQLRDAIEFYYFSGAVPELASSTKAALVTKPHIPMQSHTSDTSAHPPSHPLWEGPSPPAEPSEQASLDAEAFFLGPPAVDLVYQRRSERIGTGDADADLFSSSQVAGLSNRSFPRAQTGVTPERDLRTDSGLPTPPPRVDEWAEDYVEPYGPLGRSRASEDGSSVVQRIEQLESALENIERTLRDQLRITQVLAQLVVKRGLISSEEMALRLRSTKK